VIVRAFAILGWLWLCSAVPRQKAGPPTASALSAAVPPAALSPLVSP